MSIGKSCLIALSCVLAVFACSSSDDDGGDDNSKCAGCPFDYTGFDPNAGGTVSLQNDVMPILARACNLSTSCHKGLAGGRGSLSMGPNRSALAQGVSAPDLMTIHGAILAASVTAPSVARVAPGDPANSFLMMKMDGCQDQVAPCMVQTGAMSNGVCGDLMPQGSSLLDCDERDVIRRWIAQGALLN